jgi:hypothetical protein
MAGLMEGDAGSVAEKWARRLSGATNDIRVGIMNVTEAPGVAAARRKNVWLQNVQSSADKWATNTGRVSLEDWKKAALDKGINRIAAGATAAQSKMTAFMQRLLPVAAQISRETKRMKDQGADSIARVTYAINAMKAFAGR